MSWVSLALAAIKLAVLFMDWARTQKDYNSGRDAEVLAALKSLNEQMGLKVQIDAEVMGIPEDKLDDELKKLEP